MANFPQAVAEHESKVVVDEDGTVHITDLSVPLSIYMSEQAKRRFIQNVQNGLNTDDLDKTAPDYVRQMRLSVDNWIRPKVELAKELYPVNIEDQTIGGIRTHVITPRDGISTRNKERVLINLHGGGFVVGAGLLGIAESIPVSSIGKFKVITVDYRMAPEYRFPAASVDVASIYRALLRQYEPRAIGIYGCSAGGTLSAMATAWLQKERLAAPGAIGILSAAAFGSFYFLPMDVGSWNGDSIHIAQQLTGHAPPVLSNAGKLPPDSYLSNTDLSDPLVSPALSPSILSKFPPTLLITGTRAWDMSATVQTQRLLIRAGVDAELHLWDGMGHCFTLEADLPESAEAYAVLVRFFDEHLKHK